jgi:hypothetical protein
MAYPRSLVYNCFCSVSVDVDDSAASAPSAGCTDSYALLLKFWKYILANAFTSSGL